MALAKRFFRRLAAGLYEDDITDAAAMMAYYAVLALFPMLLFVVSLAVHALPAEAIGNAVAMLPVALPDSASEIVTAQVQRMQQSAASTGFLIGGVFFALWGASRGAAGMITALDKTLDLVESRPWWKRQVIAVAVTAGVAVMVLLALGILFVGPLVGHVIADRFGFDATFDVIWTVVRWLAAALLATGVFVVLFRFLPDHHVKVRTVLPGALTAVVLWLAISRGMGLYIDYAADYEATYGTLAGVIVFLLWLWLSNMALLVGAEVNQVVSELRKERAPRHDVLEKVAPDPVLDLDGPQRMQEQVHFAGGHLRR